MNKTDMIRFQERKLANTAKSALDDAMAKDQVWAMRLRRAWTKLDKPLIDELLTQKGLLPKDPSQ